MAKRRFEAALRGARLVVPQPMKEIPRKRPKPGGKNNEVAVERKSSKALEWVVSKKSPRHKQPIPTRASTPALLPPANPQAAMQQMILGYDPSGQVIPLDVESAKNAWSEFTLSDGTVIRLRGVLIDAKKAVNQYAADGKPIYVLQMTLVNDLQVPENLMRPKPK